MARALLDDRAATSSKPPGTGGMSSGERWPLVPTTGAVALGTVVQATFGGSSAFRADGQVAGGEAVHPAVMAAAARIPARRRPLLAGFSVSTLLTFSHPPARPTPVR